ncbi:MAG: LysR family transcriptional regulator [Pseudonocardiaceae bacterium]|nr:LysR family transcriptional regulator [Pseudonocardiaceae bacterium]
MNLTHVGAYLAVLDTGGFRPAAARLGVTQGAVSQQIARLEAELGVSLIQRGPGECRAAPGTEVFTRYARTLLELADRATRVLPDPVLVVGAASNIGTYLLQPVVKTIGDAHAEHYRIRQRLGPNAEIIECLQTGAVDVAITEWWDHRTGFETTMWREEDLVVIVGPGHAWWQRATVTLDELAEQTILGGEPTSGTGTLLRTALGEAADRLPATVNLGSTAAVKEAVHAGLGVSLVLASAADTDVQHGRLHTLRLADITLRKPLWVSHRRGLTRQDPAALFTDAILATSR